MRKRPYSNTLFFLWLSCSSIFKEGGINGQIQLTKSETTHEQKHYFMELSLVPKGSSTSANKMGVVHCQLFH